MRLRYYLSFILLLAVFGTVFLPNASQAVVPTAEVDALNAKIKASNDKIQQLQDSINRYNKSIADTHLQANSLKNQLSILDDHISEVEDEVALTKERLQTTQLELSILDFTIQDKTKELEKEKSIVASLVRKIHSDDQKNTLEIMLTNASFADFYSQLKDLEDIYTDLGRAARTLDQSRVQVVKKHEEVDARRKEYQKYQAQLENNKQDLTEQVNARERLLAETKSSESQYKTLLGSLKSQYQATENEVRGYEEQVRKKLEEQKKLKETPASSVSFTWPVPSRYITAQFHDPNYPFKSVFQHNAIDIRASQGSPVRAAASGYIGRARRCTTASCYAYVLIVHTGNLSTVYGHLSQILVNDDQFVNQGDIIGYSGATPGTVGAGPFVTGPHLHFEVRLNGIPVNPLGYLTE